MAGRPVQTKADTEALKAVLHASRIVDYKPLIAYIMRKSGCTYTEIAKVFDVSRQQAETNYLNAERLLK